MRSHERFGVVQVSGVFKLPLTCSTKTSFCLLLACFAASDDLSTKLDRRVEGGAGALGLLDLRRGLDGRLRWQSRSALQLGAAHHARTSRGSAARLFLNQRSIELPPRGLGSSPSCLFSQ